MTCNYQKIEVCSVYHESSNVRYFFSFITKVTTAKGHHQGLFKKKERERVNKSSGIFELGENLEEKVGMKSGKIENSCENLDYMYYDQVNKKLLVKVDRKIS